VYWNFFLIAFFSAGKREAGELCTLFRSLNHVKTRADIDSEQIKRLFRLCGLPAELQVINWDTVVLIAKAALAASVVPSTDDEGGKPRLPECLEKAYQGFLDNVEGLHAIRVFLGGHLLEFNARNINFLQLLPTIDQAFEFLAKRNAT